MIIPRKFALPWPYAKNGLTYPSGLRRLLGWDRKSVSNAGMHARLNYVRSRRRMKPTMCWHACWPCKESGMRSEESPIWLRRMDSRRVTLAWAFAIHFFFFFSHFFLSRYMDCSFCDIGLLSTEYVATYHIKPIKQHHPEIEFPSIKPIYYCDGSDEKNHQSRSFSPFGKWPKTI